MSRTSHAGANSTTAAWYLYWMRVDVDAAVARLAESQYGVFSRYEAVALGATKGVIARRVAAGAWKPVAPGVFRMRGAPASWTQRVMVTCLTWGPGSVASDRAAGALFELHDVRQGAIEVTIPMDRKRNGRPGIVHRRTLRENDVTTVKGIPVTTVARTLLDLANRTGQPRFERMVDDALTRGLVSMREMLSLVSAGCPRRRGVAKLRAILAARVGGSIPKSPLETILMRVFREAGLPDPVRQHRVRMESGAVYFIDFAYLEEMVAIEADSYRHHGGKTQFEADRLRGNDLTAAGWRLVRITLKQLKRDPGLVAATVRHLLTPDAYPAARSLGAGGTDSDTETPRRRSPVGR